MWVSDLNSAYFIYNPAGNKTLEQFQESRFDELRSITNFSSVQKRFLDYYTFMPSNDDYDSLRQLALKITANAKTPVDKMIAIRDYFLSKDEFGQPCLNILITPVFRAYQARASSTIFCLITGKVTAHISLEQLCLCCGHWVFRLEWQPAF